MIIEFEIRRVKDNKFVACAMIFVIDGALEEAQQKDVVIDQIIFKVMKQ